MADIVLATADASIFEIFNAELSGLNHQVHWAMDGFEAVALTEQTSPLLVLLDSPLGVYDTYAVARIVRDNPEISRHLPIILLSDDLEPSEQIAQAGFTEIFPRNHELCVLVELMAKYQKEISPLENL